MLLVGLRLDVPSSAPTPVGAAANLGSVEATRTNRGVATRTSREVAFGAITPPIARGRIAPEAPATPATAGIISRIAIRVRIAIRIAIPGAGEKAVDRAAPLRSRPRTPTL